MLLTVLAVLAANFGTGGERSEQFAQWGQVAVLAEIVALFVFVGRSISRGSTAPYSLVITESKKVPGYIGQVLWDNERCVLIYKGERLCLAGPLS